MSRTSLSDILLFCLTTVRCQVPCTGSSSSSRSSDGNSSLLNEGDSASQIPQTAVELAGYASVVWPDSLSEWLVDRAGLQHWMKATVAGRPLSDDRIMS